MLLYSSVMSQDLQWVHFPDITVKKGYKLYPFFHNDVWNIHNIRQRSRNMGASSPPMFMEGGCFLQTLEGYNMIIIMPLSTKAVIQVHKDPLNEYYL